MITYHEVIARELSLPPAGVAATIELFDEGNTIPFLARYRKEATGGLDEEQLQLLKRRLDVLRALDDRRQTVLSTIREQGKLTPELEGGILDAETLTELEDLYQPYKPRRRTRASAARELGLEPLAHLICEQPLTKKSAQDIAGAFVSAEVPTANDALAGARDIVAELISDHAAVRGAVREKALAWSMLQVEKRPDAQDARQTYQLYYSFSARVDRLKPYQVLAVDRGEAENVLRVKVEIDERDWLLTVRRHFRPDRRSPLHDELQAAISDGAQRLLLPAIERDVRRALTEKAQAHAIQVFAANLRGLLTQPPLMGHTIVGIDPGFRTGCKVAIIVPTGRVTATTTIYPHSGAVQQAAARKTLDELVRLHGVTLIAIGNGTASRETERFVASWLQADGVERQDIRYLIVNEAGASVYSAGSLARAELPGLDVTLRGAVSIARRVQDPLAELVKIDPKSIGVGLYQHDVNQKALADALAGVVEVVVNRVGVDVNTASPALLTHIAGIGPRLSERIVAFRDDQGTFAERQALLRVPGLGPKAFLQCAGFLRVVGGSEPLDTSAIHPESYAIARRVMTRAGTSMTAPTEQRAMAIETLLKRISLDQLAAEVGAGALTLADICDQIVRPGRDPREDAPAPILRSDVLSMADLQPGMHLAGTVRNIVDFGAFVDIGVKQDGLLHRSRIPRNANLAVGDVVKVAVLQVDEDRGRIGLDWVGASAL